VFRSRDMLGKLIVLSVATVLLSSACTTSSGRGTTATPPTTPAAVATPADPTSAPTGAAAARAKGKCAKIPDINPADFPASPSVTNPYLPYIPGQQFVLTGTVTSGGHVHRHRIVSTTTDLTKVIDGVRVVVVYEVDLQKGVPQESELLFTAQDLHGSVWHVGEYPEVYEKGHLVAAPEAWLSGVGGAEAGVDMPPTPHVGYVTMQGYSPKLFWDCSRVEAVNRHRCVPTGCYENVVLTNEWAPVAPHGGRQLKFSARGIGTIHALPLGEPHPEVVSLTKATCLSPAALAAIDKLALAQDQRGYRVAASVYAGLPPAEQTLSESC
jgi:hypothetical protein